MSSEKTGHRLFGLGRSRQQDPPAEPPPAYGDQSSSQHYEPPPGPPPSQSQAGPSTSTQNEVDAPPPYHDWTIIPDTALLPPPPGVSHDISSGANATWAEAYEARKWCHYNTLWPARSLSQFQLQAIANKAHTLVKPPSPQFQGEFRQDSTGAWVCTSKSSTQDSLVQTALPVYSALADSPLVTERTKTIYFEVKITRFGSGHLISKTKGGLLSRHKHQQQEEPDSGLAIGFFAPPYPSFRLPGWQRGSLGVHSDDGNRYVNNTHGGQDFTSPFKEGETVGLGMTFKLPANPPSYGQAGGQTRLDVEVFFTRDGKKEGSWDLYEERDVQDDELGVQGLEGGFDLFPAVGVFGAAEWEIRLLEREWLYRPKEG